jgi:hypothetical protein
MSMNMGNKNVPMGGPSLGPGANSLRSLLQLRDDLGIKDTTIERDGDGFRITWGSDLQETETFGQFEEAAQALRAAAQ